ncbi:C-3 sterol dehydrogenase/C-4 decarboxylase-like protein [Venturia nashicola]|uniref:C-3 sterol dehydrogenase/C-4 decarboxylase-like protein n=1 Tax=Venturia nashicola TaxID=86259 RepID=A0A4Z1PTY8_9PEZI|nr:C-3 sterol dehydrogenase/C-4 decarboxylase-like protein [Venturia nashicola]
MASKTPSLLDKHHILLTGGCGFLGSWILRQLIESYPELKITILDIQKPASWTSPTLNVRLVEADITDKLQVLSSFESVKPTIVIHTAGYITVGSARHKPSNEIRARTFNINVNGTKNVLEAAKAVGVKSFIYTSSCTVVMDDKTRNHPNENESAPTGHATLIYGQSKTESENLVLAANTALFRTTALRPSVIFGPGDYNFLPSVYQCIARNETPWIIGDANNLWDFVYVSNVADAHVLAMENLLTTGTAAGEAFFISNGEPVTFRAFCLAVWAAFGHVPKFEVSIPAGLAHWMGWASEWVDWLKGSEGPLTRGSIKDATQTEYVSIAKARIVLGYEPRVLLPQAVKISCQVSKKAVSITTMKLISAVYTRGTRRHGHKEQLIFVQHAFLAAI